MTKRIQEILESMEPAEALAVLAHQLKKNLSCLGQEARIDFVIELMDGPGGDKISSMVNR